MAKLLEATLAKWIDRLEAEGISSDATHKVRQAAQSILHVPVFYNTRLESTAGRAHSKRINGKWTPSHIELNVELMLGEPIQSIWATLLHEVAHLLAPGDMHGLDWQLECAGLGIKPERCHNYVTMQRRRR